MFFLYEAYRHVTTTTSIKYLTLEGTHSDFVSSGLEGLLNGHNLVFPRLLILVDLLEMVILICYKMKQNNVNSNKVFKLHRRQKSPCKDVYLEKRLLGLTSL